MERDTGFRSGDRRVLARARIVAALPAAVLLALVPRSVAAQRSMPREMPEIGEISISPEIGVAIPASDLGDYENPGASVGVHLSYQLLPRLALDADGVLDALNGVGLQYFQRVPDMHLWQYTAGIEAELLPPSVGAWSIVADGGVGGTTFRSADYLNMLAGGGLTNFRHTYFTADGGLRIGYQINPSVTVFADGKAYWANVDPTDTESLAALDADRLHTFNGAVTFPLTVGVRAHM